MLYLHRSVQSSQTISYTQEPSSTDSYTEITYQQKHQNSSFMLSIGCFIVSFALLWWNQARTVRSSALYSLVRKKCRSLSPIQVKQASSDTLLHFTDPNIQVITPAFDPYFSLKPSQQTIAIRRVVELYQWKENVTQNRRDVGGGKVQVEKNYNYTRQWSQKFIDSSNFKIKQGHQNLNFPVSIRSQTFYCAKIKCCEDSIEISRDQCQNKLSANQRISQSVLEEKVEKMQGFKNNGSDYLYYQQKGQNQIGSLRVSFLVNESKELSVIGVKQVNKIEEYFGDHGYSLLQIQQGSKSKDRIINGLESQNRILAWILRLIGVVLMYIGFYGMFEVFLYYIRWVPLLEPMLNFAAEVFAGLLTGIFSLLTIAIAWVFYRPWLLALVVAGIALVVGMIIYK